jgi:5-methylcytosine-specific restriction enzyme subunit McrC
MNPEKRLTVFEHDRLRVDGETFRHEHLRLLDRWNSSFSREAIQVGRNSVKFSQYVGVLQVGDLVIEILPKIGRFEVETTARDRWRDALWRMLQVVGVVRFRVAGDTSLRTTHFSLLDMLFGEFLSRLEEIVKRGLSKGHLHDEGNLVCCPGNTFT